MVSDVTFSGQVANAQTTQNQRVTLADDFAQFLSLLTTQLQNQDPLAPLDSNEFTQQLVQFSQVEQQINTNQKLDDLVALQLNNAITSSLGYVGLDVSYISAELSYDGVNPSDIKYSLGANSATSTINIFSEEGTLIQSLDGETGAGVHDFTWDGRDLLGRPVPAGTYIISVDSLDLAENVIDTTTVVTGRVKGVEQQNGIIFALVGDRAVATTAILNAQSPQQTQSTNTGGNDVPAV